MQFLNGFVFFGIAVWLPTLFLKMGFSFVHSLLFTGIVTGSGAVGNVVGGILLDRWGRRPTLITFSILGRLSLAGWGFSPNAVAVILIGAVGAFFSFGVADSPMLARSIRLRCEQPGSAFPDLGSASVALSPHTFSESWSAPLSPSCSFSALLAH